MAKTLDYSKWDHIEVSDDEDDVHPNIDTPSLFRWRHQARVDRMEQSKKEKEEFSKGYEGYQRKMLEIKQSLKSKEEENAVEELEKLKLEYSEMQKYEEEWKNKEEELRRKERLEPQNIDTLCKDGMSKTIINKPKEELKNLSEDEFFERQSKFTDKNEKLIKKFGMLRRYEDSESFLVEHPELACEETANYLVIWCINLEVEEKSDLMAHVAHQTIVMQFILELAKTLKTDPRNCIRAFFSRIKLAEKPYMDAFNDELQGFRDRVKSRAQARLEDALRTAEAEERQARLGPGGLDPVEVFESLPKELQDCFESKNVDGLQDVLLKLPRGEAEYHMKRCVDSGMWVADAKAAAAQAEVEPATDKKAEEKPATDKKAEEKPSTEKKAEEKPSTEKKAEDKPTTE